MITTQSTLALLLGAALLLAVPAPQAVQPARYRYPAQVIAPARLPKNGKPCWRFLKAKPAAWPDSYGTRTCLTAAVLPYALGYGPLAYTHGDTVEVLATVGQSLPLYPHKRTDGTPYFNATAPGNKSVMVRSTDTAVAKVKWP